MNRLAHIVLASDIDSQCEAILLVPPGTASLATANTTIVLDPQQIVMLPVSDCRCYHFEAQTDRNYKCMQRSHSASFGTFLLHLRQAVHHVFRFYVDEILALKVDYKRAPLSLSSSKSSSSLERRSACSKRKK